MSEHLLKFQQRFESGDGIVGIIGLGYVGLPLALTFAKNEYNVIGFDVDQKKINTLNKGKSILKHISDIDIKIAVESKKLIVTNKFEHIVKVDAIIMCLPTPLGTHKEPDLNYILSALKSIEPFLRSGQLLSLESTTYPGTTEEIVLPAINTNKNIKAGDNFFVVYSPEREDPGNKKFTTSSIPKVIGGYTDICLEAGLTVYKTVIKDLVPVSSLKVAEMTKILENIHRAVNIGLINEIKMLSIRMNIDINEVIKAASTKPFGFVPYYPGPGLGGHCIPIDPYYLTWKAREYGMHTRFVELAGEINSSMPSFVVSRIILALNSLSLSVSASKILILGASYKKNIDDIRESPSLEIIKELIDLKSIVSFSDPYVKNFCIDNTTMKSINLSPEVLKSFDLVALLVDHDCFDYNCIRLNAKILVDTRGKFSNSYNIWQA